MQFNIGWFIHPFFINGDYPEIMKERIEEIRNQIQKPDEGLPKFTEDEKTKNRDEEINTIKAELYKIKNELSQKNSEEEKL